MASILRSLRYDVVAFRLRGLLVPALAACALVLAIGIAACGTTPSSTPLAGSTNCGTIIWGRGAGSSSGAVSAEQCFFQAYQKCQSATLGFSTMGIDTSNTYAFTVQPKSSGGCAVAAVDTYFFASGGGRTTVKTYTCSGAALQGDTLQVRGCGNVGDITVSGILRAPTPSPTR